MTRVIDRSSAPWIATLCAIATLPLAAAAQDTPNGQLTIVTEPPGARVFVDGREAGLSPVSVPDLLPGAHLVVAIAESGERVQEVAEVEPGRSSLVQLTLPVASPGPPPTPPGTSPPTGTPPTGPPPPTGAPPTGAPPTGAPPIGAPPTGTPSGPASPATALGAVPPAGPSQELAPSDLSANVEPTDDGGAHVEEVPIAPTGFPGLLGQTLGVRVDLPIYVGHPEVVPEGTRRDNEGAIASSRLSFEYTFHPTWQLIAAIDMPNGAFGLGLGINIPGHIPLSRQVPVALQPHLAFLFYGSGEGAFVAGETTLRLGYAPMPHLVIAAQVGVVIVGVVPFDDSSTLTEGTYVGPMIGGGAEWAFY